MKIVLATFGSLGDLHPMLALGIELQSRGHEITVAAMDFYRERIEKNGFGFHSMRPHFDIEDRELARRLMHPRKGPEILINEIIFPQLRGMFDDLMAGTEGADLLVTGEVVYVAKSIVEKTGVKWISTSLAPLSFFSSSDPNVYPTAEWYEHLRFLPAAFHGSLFKLMRRVIAGWLVPYKSFRRELGLDENHDPIFFGKNSDLLHLAMFSKVLAKPQPDWHRPTLQTGFCFYDGQNDVGKMPEGLQEFLDAGEPPVVFTLGSAAVWDAGDFFEESAKAAKLLGRRAVLIYGMMNEAPKIVVSGEWRVMSGGKFQSNIAAVEYAPFSRVFPQAACVVHQAGAGTTAQALRAGVPHLIMPYGHDQFDNAARCARLGVARRISRGGYTAEKAAKELRGLLSDLSYKANAVEASKIVKAEHGTTVACDAIEQILNRK
ncbi:MAG: glycosyltransferase [Pyrinomonadaceae bacterium]